MARWIDGLDWIRQVGLLVAGLILFGLFVFAVYEGVRLLLIATYSLRQQLKRCCIDRYRGWKESK